MPPENVNEFDVAGNCLRTIQWKRRGSATMKTGFNPGFDQTAFPTWNVGKKNCEAMLQVRKAGSGTGVPIGDGLSQIYFF